VQRRDCTQWRSLYRGRPFRQYPGAGPDSVGRISKFTKDGKFVKSFGRWGAAPGEFKTPHDIALDSQDGLFVADRGNMRIQILGQDGAFIAEWAQFSRQAASTYVTIRSM